MAGFANISEFVNAEAEGRSWITQFRKTFPAGATTASNFNDFSYVAGSPLANFYASSPLEAAVISPSRGIYVPSVSPYMQVLKNITVMTVAGAVASVITERQEMLLADYLLYYPFIDMDDLAQQDMVQSTTIPRYDYGYVMAISQSPSSAIGQFTFTYTNQDGVAGQVSPNIFTQIVSGGGQSITTQASGAGFHLFLPLQLGDRGVKSIESITFTAPGGGLMALVIVHPLLRFYVASTSRRTTSGNLESYGAASAIDSMINLAAAPIIKDGAILNLVSRGNAGSMNQSQLVGTIETVWN